MAASGAMADFARMPTERKALVFIVIGAVLGLLYFQFVFKSLNTQVDEARVQHETQIATSAQLTNDIPKYDIERQHMKALKETIDENQKALPTEAELPAFYETLNRKILESGVELSNWQSQPDAPLESFVKVPVQIEITGSFLQLKRFFASLVQKNVGRDHAGDDDNADDRERIVSIENLNLTAPSVKNGVIVLTARFTAATFRQEDKPVPAPGAAAAPGAPAAAGAPAGAPPPPSPNGSTGGAAAPPPPPMPSAATPAGAKARVEDSLEKGADRNSNAGGVNEAKTPSGGGSDRLKGGM